LAPRSDAADTLTDGSTGSPGRSGFQGIPCGGSDDRVHDASPGAEASFATAGMEEASGRAATATATAAKPPRRHVRMRRDDTIFVPMGPPEGRGHSTCRGCEVPVGSGTRGAVRGGSSGRFWRCRLQDGRQQLVVRKHLPHEVREGGVERELCGLPAVRSHIPFHGASFEMAVIDGRTSLHRPLVDAEVHPHLGLGVTRWGLTPTRCLITPSRRRSSSCPRASGRSVHRERPP